MLRWYYSLLLLWAPVVFFGQYEETFSGVFNSFHRMSAPYQKDPTFPENIALIKQHHIKSILVKRFVPESGYMDSLIRHGLEKFTEGHISVLRSFYYTPEGLLSAFSVVPMNIRQSKEDSASYRFVRTSRDSIQRTYRIDYFGEKQLTSSVTYSNALLTEEHYNKSYNLRYRDKNQADHDTTWTCTVYRKYEYDAKGRLVKRSYNNTEYIELDLKDLCNIEESEIYEYRENEIVITKYPFRDNKRYTASRYVNKLRLDKQNQVLRSGFYYDTDNDPWVIYACRYDKQHHLTGIYESDNERHPFEYPIKEFRNTYDKQGRLISAEEDKKEEPLIYYFNPEGLLIRIANKDHPDICTTFEYTFY